ncbi:MAG: hypothetical protein ACI9R3_001247 [Verrucomicrobiales bacterium]|jgi:hypothetical protein
MSGLFTGMKSVIIGSVLCFSLLTHCSAQEESATTPEFDPVRVVKRFPPIIEPDFIKASEAQINDNELVLGVTINGASRAYPINMLTQPTREIVNDRLGGEVIAATW